MGGEICPTCVHQVSTSHLRDDFVFQAAKEQNGYLRDLGESLFCRPDLMAERSQETSRGKCTADSQLSISVELRQLTLVSVS
jgi:hypothetical protein